MIKGKYIMISLKSANLKNIIDIYKFHDIFKFAIQNNRDKNITRLKRQVTSIEKIPLQF